jgi:hypothetical protein
MLLDALACGTSPAAEPGSVYQVGRRGARIEGLSVQVDAMVGGQ